MMFLLAVWLSLAPPDTLHLAALQAAAAAHDPRAAQPSLYAAQSALRLENLGVAWKPQLAVRGQGFYQSDVPTFPASPLTGQPSAVIPKEQFQVTLNVEQRLYDGGTTAQQRALERAATAVSVATVAVDRYGLRQQVSDAYFSALALQAQADLLDLLDGDFATREALLAARLRAGAALPGDVLTIQAERLRVRQQRLEVEAAHRTALATLAERTGTPVPPDAVLALPDALPPVAEDPRTRPEYTLFDRQRARLYSEADATRLHTRPQVTAYALGGVARPGYDFLDDRVVPIGQVGVRVSWTLLDWRQGTRERAALRLQRDVLATQEATFAQNLRVAAAALRETIARLDAQLALDADLIALRTHIAAEAAHQLRSGTVPVATVIEKDNDVFEARLNEATRRLARARAHYDLHTTLGAADDTP